MEIKTDYKPTPKEIAQLFCELDSKQMAEFFTHCRELTEAWESKMGIYCQALWIKKEMPMGSEGAKFIMDLSAPWFVHTLLYVDEHGERERA